MIIPFGDSWKDKVIEEYLKEHSEPIDIKGFKLYYSYEIGYINIMVLNNRGDVIRQNQIDISNSLEKAIDIFTQGLFTEEELCTPCKSQTEYVEKQHFIQNIYIRNISIVLYYFNIELYNDKYIFDPISKVVVNASDEDFVKHHIELYVKFKMCQKPSIFLGVTNLDIINMSGYSKEERFLMYYMLLPFAKDNDWMLPDANKYITNNARDMAKTFYSNGQTRLPKELVLKDYIKKPTMKKLLEMANEKGDTEFAAILLDKMKESEVSKNRFSL